MSITEKFRHRSDKLMLKETDLAGNRVTETFDTGR